MCIIIFIKKEHFEEKSDPFEEDRKRIREKFGRLISRFSPAGRERLQQQEAIRKERRDQDIIAQIRQNCAEGFRKPDFLTLPKYE